MEWLLFALLAPLFWAFSNYIDKYSLDKYVKGIFDFMFFSTVTSWFFFLALVLIFGFPTLTTYSVLPIILGMVLIYSYGFYGKALEVGETSKLIILLQGIPVLTLLLGIVFLGQHLNGLEWTAFLLVLIGGTVVSVEKVKGDFLVTKGFSWMMTAIVIWSVMFLVSDYALEHMSFWDFFILDNLGNALAGIPLMLYGPSRRQIMLGIKTAIPQKYGWFILNNFLDFFGQMSIKKSLALAPSAGLVTVAMQVQSVYIVILGVVLTLLVPDKIKEDITRKNLIIKITGALVIFLGIFVLFSRGQ